MPSRMEKYYNSFDVPQRSVKNKELYKSIYEDCEYSNVEGISVIEKNEKIDLDKIYDLINSAKEETKEKKEKTYTTREYVKPNIDDEDKSYDILDVLKEAKEERPKTSNYSNTQYNILKNINLKDGERAPQLSDEELQSMIDAVTKKKEKDYTLDLLADLKTIHDGNLKDEIEDETNKENDNLKDIDKSFYTSSLNFSEDDFEQIKDNIDKNNKLTKVIIFILSVIVVTAIMVGVYFYLRK